MGFFVILLSKILDNSKESSNLASEIRDNTKTYNYGNGKTNIRKH